MPNQNEVPVTLGGQLRRHLGTFVAGGFYLLVFNALRAAIDFVLKRGVDDLHQGRFSDTSRVGLILVGLTAVAVRGADVEFEAIPETLRKTTLGARRRGDRVNVEAALKRR